MACLEVEGMLFSGTSPFCGNSFDQGFTGLQICSFKIQGERSVPAKIKCYVSVDLLQVEIGIAYGRS